MGEVASSAGLQAVVGALARTSDHDFDITRTLKALAEVAQAFAGARGVAIEHAVDGQPSDVFLSIGEIISAPRRLPIIAEGSEIGFIALYGAAMFGPATADRTQIIADLAALALVRARKAMQAPSLDDARYRLLTGVGLNLRNSLGAASGYMQLVEMEGELTLMQEEYVTRSRGAVSSAVSLISDLLELTRADAGKLAFDREAVPINALAREAARKHADTARAKEVQVRVNASQDNPVILTDSSYVQQIVDVLVYNAVRYTPPSGEVTILTDLREGRRSNDPAQWVCVAVTDTGRGIPEADQVFEEVHRVEQGKGNVRFRLAICRRVARLLRGDLTLETEKGVGSTFTLWLPAPAQQ